MKLYEALAQNLTGKVLVNTSRDITLNLSDYDSVEEALEELSGADVMCNNWVVQNNTFTFTLEQLIDVWNRALPQGSSADPSNLAPNSMRWKRFLETLQGVR